MTQNNGDSLRLLTIAPATSQPPMIGDAKRIYRLARGMLSNGIDNVYVGKNFVYRGDGDVEQPVEQQYREWPRNVVGLLAVLKRGHYNEVKHCTRRWLKFVTPYLLDTRYNAIYCHFVFTWPLIAHLIGDRPLVVDTHNSEWQWYESFGNSSRSPIVRKLCASSAARASVIVSQLPAGTIMAHVSEQDAQAYRDRRPDLEHVIVPNGGDPQPRLHRPDYSSGRKRLLFFASLHGKMSLDALTHFAKTFWPSLSDVCDMCVAGANPSPQIAALCEQFGWHLKKNLSEEAVDEVFNAAHFSVMPFSYGAGSKLKFFDACARGVPVLSTVAGACGQEDLPTFVHVSEDPRQWREVLLQTKELPADWQQQVHRFGERFSWGAIARAVIPAIERRRGSGTITGMHPRAGVKCTGASQ